MPAYTLFDNLEVLDPAGLAAYRDGVAELVAAAGGRYVLVGGPATTLEGDLRLTYPVLIEFPDASSAASWYDSSEYRPLRDLRWRSVRSRGVLLGGE